MVISDLSVRLLSAGAPCLFATIGASFDRRRELRIAYRVAVSTTRLVFLVGLFLLWFSEWSEFDQVPPSSNLSSTAVVMALVIICIVATL